MHKKAVTTIYSFKISPTAPKYGIRCLESGCVSGSYLTFCIADISWQY